MIYKYEMACREAGLNEEQTKAIRQVFDREQKRLKRRNEALEELHKKYGFEIYSVSELCGQDEKEDFEVMDPGMDVETAILHKMDLERLRELLAELPEEDREILLVYHSGEFGSQAAYQKKYNLTKGQADYRVMALLGELRKKF